MTEFLPADEEPEDPAIGRPATAPLGLTQSVIGGIGWTAASQAIRVGGQLVVQIVLARLLLPEDFGLIGQVFVFSAFATLISEFGIETAIAQRSRMDDRVASGAFWLGLTIATFLAISFLLAAPAIAAFFDEPRLTGLVRAVSISFPIVSLGAVQRGLLAHQLRFRTIAVGESLAFLIGAVIGVSMAVNGHGAASFAGQLLVTSAVGTVTLSALSGWRPQSWRQSDARPLLRFTSNLLGFNVINYWSRNADNLLVGRFLGPAALGVYSRAYVLMLFPLTQIALIIGRVVIPSLSKMQSDLPRMKTAYLRSLSLTTLVTFPMMTGLLALADQFVNTALGEEWKALVPVLRILAIVGLSQSAFATTGWIYQATGRTDLLMRWGLASSVIIVTGFGIGVAVGGPVAVAASYFITSVLLLGYPVLAIPYRLIDLPVREAFRKIAPALLASLISGVAAFATGEALRSNGDAVSLAGGSLAGLAVYTLALAALRAPAWSDARSLVGERLHAASRAAL